MVFLGDELVDVMPDQLFGLVAKHGRPCGIHTLEDPLEVDHHHQIGRGVPHQVALLRADGDLVDQLLVHLTQLLLGGQPLLFGDYLTGDLDSLVQQPEDAAIFSENRRGTDVPIGYLRLTVAHHWQLDPILCEAFSRAHRMMKRWCHDVPDLSPDLCHRPTQSGRVPVGHGNDVSIVIEHSQLRPPEHRSQQRRMQTGADHGPQGLRPTLDRTERRRRPVMVSHQRTHLPATGEKGRHLVFRVGHVRASSSGAVTRWAAASCCWVRR